MRTLPLVALGAWVLVACGADSHDGGDGDGGSRVERDAGGRDAGGRDAGGRDGGGRDGGGDRPPCADGVSVTQDGVELVASRSSASGTWTALGGREVFRLHLQTQYDPIPEAVDDEYSLDTFIDVAPWQLRAASSGPLAIDQEVSTPATARGEGFADDATVGVTASAAHTYPIRRVLVERAGFGNSPAAAAYHVSGELTLGMLPEHRIYGTLSLDLEGRVPRAFETSTELHIEGCFDFDAAPPGDCEPGEECGADCLDAEEWACWDCGTLYVTHDCKCRPDLAPLTECEGDEPAGEGELCGEEWWCDRECAQGLRCTPNPSYGDEDAAVPGLCEHYATCERSVATDTGDPDACLVALRFDDCCAAYEPVTRAALEADPCLVQVPVGTTFGTDVTGPCQTTSCVGMSCPQGPPPSHLAVSDGAGGCAFADECASDDDCVLGSGTGGCCDCPRPLPAALFEANVCALREGDGIPPGAACPVCTAPVQCGMCPEPPTPHCATRGDFEVCQ